MILIRYVSQLLDEDKCERMMLIVEQALEHLTGRA